jgi:GNAT superfamily N-acetyltransferase
MAIEIIQSDIKTAVQISRLVPELSNPHDESVYRERMVDSKKLILVALWNGKHAGFKVGYDKFKDGSFYSWMGGVVPEYRRHHVAKALANYQEDWASKEGFKRIVFKTRNRHRAMLCFAIKNGFSIVDVEEKEDHTENRILLMKEL